MLNPVTPRVLAKDQLGGGSPQGPCGEAGCACGAERIPQGLAGGGGEGEGEDGVGPGLGAVEGLHGAASHDGLVHEGGEHRHWGGDLPVGGGGAVGRGPGEGPSMSSSDGITRPESMSKHVSHGLVARSAAGPSNSLLRKMQTGGA